MKKLVAIIAAILTAGAAYLLGWSDFLPVKRVSIMEEDKEIVSELKAKLSESPNPVEKGEPIARVDKREITARLRTLIWVDSVEVRRNFFSGEVKISVEPRSAIAQLDPKWSANPAELAFLGADLDFFYVPRSEVAKAGKSGNVDWSELPSLTLGSDDLQLRQDVQTLMLALKEAGASIQTLSAVDKESLTSRISLAGRQLDISWGSVKELPLKLDVLQRLIELKANRNVKRVDLSNPISPIVSNNN